MLQNGKIGIHTSNYNLSENKSLEKIIKAVERTLSEITQQNDHQGAAHAPNPQEAPSAGIGLGLNSDVMGLHGRIGAPKTAMTAGRWVSPECSSEDLTLSQGLLYYDRSRSTSLISTEDAPEIHTVSQNTYVIG